MNAKICSYCLGAVGEKYWALYGPGEDPDRNPPAKFCNVRCVALWAILKAIPDPSRPMPAATLEQMRERHNQLSEELLNLTRAMDSRRAEP